MIDKTMVSVRTMFVGFHSWPEAPDDVAYLRSKHRHVFHVGVSLETYVDRGIEFHQLKRNVVAITQELGVSTAHGEQLLGNKSCEMIAQRIYRALVPLYVELSDQMFVEVSEDGECSAMVSGTLKEESDEVLPDLPKQLSTV